MIIKQKLYSNPAVRKLVRRVGEEVVATKNALRKSFRLKPSLQADMIDKALVEEGKAKAKKVAFRAAKGVPVNKEQARRIVAKKKVGALKKVVAAENYLGTHTPGQIVADGVGEVAKRPLFVATAGVGYAPLKFGVYIPGTNAAALAVDEGARKLVPAYNKVTNKTSNAYNKHGRRLVEGFVNSIPVAV